MIALIATGVFTLVAFAAIRAPPIATRIVTKRTMSMNPNACHAFAPVSTPEASNRLLSPRSTLNHVKMNITMRSSRAETAAIISPWLSLLVSN